MISKLEKKELKLLQKYNNQHLIPLIAAHMHKVKSLNIAVAACWYDDIILEI